MVKPEKVEGILNNLMEYVKKLRRLAAIPRAVQKISR
jgi:hypothetical protein